MKPVHICEECHEPLPGDAPEGLCPKCLLRFGGAQLGLAVAEPEARRFGEYEVLEKIGQGGMGAVYKARQVNLDRMVALKVLPLGLWTSPELVERFRSEAKAAAALRHPNIVAVHDVGEHEGQPFFSMDLVEGRTLAELVRDQPLPARRAATYLKSVAEAVHYAHQQGILHRDLKPSNILIDSCDQPRITDFGLAKRLRDHQLSTAPHQITLTGQVLGSPDFISPEQAEGHADAIGPPSDIYSLGALLYHLLTRRPPFQADTLTTLLKQVISAEPVPPRSLNPSIPRDLDTICLKCLEKEPARRYATAEALADDLGRFLRGEPVLARPVTVALKAWKWCRARPALASLGLALAATCTAGVTAAYWQLQQTRASELAAQQNAYAADMNLAQRALAEGDLGRTKEFLTVYRPHSGQRDLRGWEWRYFWRLCRSDEKSSLPRFPRSVASLAYSPTSEWLGITLENGPSMILDYATGKHIAELPALWIPKGPMAFSPHGSLFAWGAWATIEPSQTAMIGLWDLVQNREVGRFLHASELLSVAFSPDGKRLAALWRDGVVQLYEVAPRALLATLSTPPQEYNHYGSVQFSPDGHTLAIGESRPRIRLWDASTRKETLLEVPPPADGVNALAFTPDGRWLAAAGGYWARDICVWDLSRTNQSLRLAGHRGWISALAFSPKDSTLASASCDQTIRLWDLSSLSEIGRLKGHTAEIWALAWSPDGRELVSGSRDGAVCFWDPQAQPRSAEHQLLALPVHMFGFAFAADRREFFTAGPPEGTVTAWDMQRLQPVQTLTFVGTNNMSVAAAPDGQLLATGDAAGKIRIWDLPGRRLVTSIILEGVWYYRLQFSPRGHYLGCVVFPRPGTPSAQVWDTRTWRPMVLPAEASRDVRTICLSPDETVLAAGGTDGRARWWDLKTGAPLGTFHSEEVPGEHYVAFSPDGSLFVSGRASGQLTMWDTRTRKKRFSTSHPRAINALAFSPDSRRVVTTSSGGADAVKIWDAQTGRDLCTLSAGPGIYYAVSFSPDGQTLAAVSTTGKTLVWRASGLEDTERR